MSESPEEHEADGNVGPDPEPDPGPDLEPGSDPPAPADSPKRADADWLKRSADEPAPFDLELDPDWDQAEPAKRSVRALDVCPNCGAAMRGLDKMLCMRCGFNLKTLKTEKTQTGEIEVDDEAEGDAGEPKKPAPLVMPGRGGVRLPLIAAAVSAIVLIVGYLARADALFVNRPETPSGPVVLTFNDGLVAVLQFLGLMVVWTTGAVAALACVAALDARPLGDVRLAAARMLGILAVVRLSTFVDLDSKQLEWVVEAGAHLVLYASLVLALFRMNRRNTGLTVGVTALMVVGLYLLAKLISLVGVI